MRGRVKEKVCGHDVLVVAQEPVWFHKRYLFLKPSLFSYDGPHAIIFLSSMDVEDIRPRMEKALEIVQGEVSKIRTGRASATLVEDIVCPVYGGSQKLRVVELGTILTPEPQQIIISPFDPSIIHEIRNGILTANVGLNPVIDGEVIRIAIPPLSEERRQELVRLLGRHLENGRIMIRQIRHDKMIDIKKAAQASELSEDERFNLERELQKITDEFVEKINQMGAQKEEELMKV